MRRRGWTFTPPHLGQSLTSDRQGLDGTVWPLLLAGRAVEHKPSSRVSHRIALGLPGLALGFQPSLSHVFCCLPGSSGVPGSEDGFHVRNPRRQVAELQKDPDLPSQASDR